MVQEQGFCSNIFLPLSSALGTGLVAFPSLLVFIINVVTFQRKKRKEKRKYPHHKVYKSSSLLFILSLNIINAMFHEIKKFIGKRNLNYSVYRVWSKPTVPSIGFNNLHSSLQCLKKFTKHNSLTKLRPLYYYIQIQSLPKMAPNST